MVNERDERASPERPQHVLRPLRTHAELVSCVALQREVWGAAFSECVPISLLKVTQRLGGTLIGAWSPEGRLDGFVFGLAGLQEGRPVHWSDMLAVREGLRDRGLGLALKARQREELLAAGTRVCYWTFDPLESRNAWLNLARLGAVIREYAPDLYGDSDSPLHRGIGTDRFVATWPLDSPRVRARLEGRERPPSLDELGALPLAFAVEGAPGVAVGERGRQAAATGRGLPAPGEPTELRGCERFLVPVPRSIQEIKATDPELARLWRRATRAPLVRALAGGFQVSELLRPEGGGGVGYYLVERVPEEAPRW